jgi:hypothetical protein
VASHTPEPVGGRAPAGLSRVMAGGLRPWQRVPRHPGRRLPAPARADACPLVTPPPPKAWRSAVASAMAGSRRGTRAGAHTPDSVREGRPHSPRMPSARPAPPAWPRALARAEPDRSPPPPPGRAPRARRSAPPVGRVRGHAVETAATTQPVATSSSRWAVGQLPHQAPGSGRSPSRAHRPPSAAVPAAPRAATGRDRATPQPRAPTARR